MQSLEDHEDPLGVRGSDADSVVLTGEFPVIVLWLRCDPDYGRLVHPPELDRVGDQVLEELSHQCRVADDGGEAGNGHLGVGVGDRGIQTVNGFARGRVQIHRAAGRARLADPGERQ
jgi:hypothetical protein